MPTLFPLAEWKRRALSSPALRPASLADRVGHPGANGLPGAFCEFVGRRVAALVPRGMTGKAVATWKMAACFTTVSSGLATSWLLRSVGGAQSLTVLVADLAVATVTRTAGGLRRRAMPASLATSPV